MSERSYLSLENAVEIAMSVTLDMHAALDKMFPTVSARDMMRERILEAADKLTAAEMQAPDFYNTVDWYMVCDDLATECAAQYPEFAGIIHKHALGAEDEAPMGHVSEYFDRGADA